LAASFLLSSTSLISQALLPFATGVLIYNLLVHLIPTTLKQKWGLPIMVLAAVTTMLALHSH